MFGHVFMSVPSKDLKIRMNYEDLPQHRYMHTKDYTNCRTSGQNLMNTQTVESHLCACLFTTIIAQGTFVCLFFYGLISVGVKSGSCMPIYIYQGSRQTENQKIKVCMPSYIFSGVNTTYICIASKNTEMLGKITFSSNIFLHQEGIFGSPETLVKVKT